MFNLSDYTFMLSKLPTEILFKILRDYIDYEEKVRLLTYPFFQKILLKEYAWRTLPKVSLKSLQFISQHYLHVIAPGFYISKNDSYDIFTVFINKQTGCVLVEGYELATVFTAGPQETSKRIQQYFNVLDLKEILIHFKASCHFAPTMTIASKISMGGFFFSKAVRNCDMFSLNDKFYMYGSKTLKNIYEYDSSKNIIKATYFCIKRNMF